MEIKHIYLMAIAGFFIVLALSMVVASSTTLTNASDNSTGNMTFGKCVKAATQAQSACQKTAKNTFESCKKSAGKDKTKLKQCKTSLDTNNNVCKAIFKIAKTDCKKYPKK